MQYYSTCLRCGTKFYPVRSDQLFCTQRCRTIYYRDMLASQVLRCSSCFETECPHYRHYPGKLRPRDCPRRGRA